MIEEGKVYRLETDTEVLYLTPKEVGIEICVFYVVNENGDLKHRNLKGAKYAVSGALKMTPETKILTKQGRLKQLQLTNIPAPELPQILDLRPPAALRTDRAMRRRI